MANRFKAWLRRLLRSTSAITSQQDTPSASSSTSTTAIQPPADDTQGTTDGDESHNTSNRCRMVPQMIDAASTRFLSRWRTWDRLSRHVSNSQSCRFAFHSRNKARPTTRLPLQSSVLDTTGQRPSSRLDESRVRPVIIEPYDRVFSETRPGGPSHPTPSEELWNSVNAMRPSRNEQDSRIPTGSGPNRHTSSPAAVSHSNQQNEQAIGDNQGHYSLIEALTLHMGPDQHVHRTPPSETDTLEESDQPPSYFADYSPPAYSMRDDFQRYNMYGVSPISTSQG